MQTQHAAVIGHPSGIPCPPFIQKRLFQLSGIPMEYQVLDLPDLAAGLARLRELDCFNVTIPYKQAILPFLDAVDPRAARFGSVNTVRVEGGRLTGYTTDGAGCARPWKTTAWTSRAGCCFWATGAPPGPWPSRSPSAGTTRT